MDLIENLTPKRSPSLKSSNAGHFKKMEMNIDSETLTPNKSLKTSMNEENFQFPPDISISGGGPSQDPTNFRTRSRRSFTPYKSSFIIKSPEFSPIAFNEILDYDQIKRLPRDEVRKAKADSTINQTINEASGYDGDFLIPPQPRRLTRRSMPMLNTTPEKKDNKSIQKNLMKKQHQRLNYLMVSPSKSFLNKRITIENLLSEIGLTKYIETFNKEEIDANVFFTLTNADLKRIGINQSSDREIILKLIKKLCT